jgi:hypothetical protein
MDPTNGHPADQLALKAASLLATSSPRPASARSRRRTRKLYGLKPAETTMGRFQQAVANERSALVATAAGAAYLRYKSNKGRLA